MMRQGKRIFSAVLVLVMAVVLLQGNAALRVQAEDARPIPDIRLTVGDKQETPNYQAGQEVTLKLNVTNRGKVAATNVRISPVIDEQTAWPFELKNMNEEQTVETIEAGATAEVSWTWTVRSDVETKAYKAVFNILYWDENGDNSSEYEVKKQIFVKTTAQPKEEPKPEENNEEENNGGETPNPEEPQPEVPATEDLSGGFYNSEPIMSGGSGGGSGNASVPRVIVTGFTTDPGTVNAGSNFKLTVQVKNTSTTTAVSNMLFDLQAPSAGTEAAAEAPAFLPASGSSTIYLDRIPAGETRAISIDLNARADLVQKPYSITMTMQYENSEATQFEGSSSLAIPVQQAARFEFSEIEIAPSSIQVGEEANLTCSLYNTGRTKLYNVKVKFTGDGISAKDVFVGNVDSGATGTIDGMLMGESEIPAGTKSKMVVSYEDESGNVSTKEVEFELEVLPAAMDDTGTMMETPVEEPGFPVFPVAVAVVAVAAVGVAVLLIRRKKKKQALAEEEDLADEVDRFTEDE